MVTATERPSGINHQGRRVVDAGAVVADRERRMAGQIEEVDLDPGGAGPPCILQGLGENGGRPDIEESSDTADRVRADRRGDAEWQGHNGSMLCGATVTPASPDPSPSPRDLEAPRIFRGDDPAPRDYDDVAGVIIHFAGREIVSRWLSVVTSDSTPGQAPLPVPIFLECTRRVSRMRGRAVSSNRRVITMASGKVTPTQLVQLSLNSRPGWSFSSQAAIHAQ
jgi:hypothetical protein